MSINLLSSTSVSTSIALPKELQQLLQQIVNDVVSRLGCIGAIATTLEQGNALHVRAASFDVPDNVVEQYLNKEGLTLFNEDAVVYLDKDKKNLNGLFLNETGDEPKHAVSDRLFDLLRPLASRRFSDKLQREFGIKQVVAVPFILRNEMVGSLIATKQSEFSQQDIEILSAFGQQTAVAIQSQKRLSSMEVLERIIFSMQEKMLNETKVLQTIVDTVVNDLNYVGAMVATLEMGNSLPVRAYALKSNLANLLSKLESKAGISLVGPRAVVFLDDEKYKDNLSVKAVKGLNGRPEKYIMSGSLHDLLRPIADKSLASIAQRILQIKQVIAVPFFLENEVVGNLFVASSKKSFSEWEISVLTAFGQQAAVGIRNARLYNETEKQRQIAQMFGRMAFSSTAAVHALGNHLSSVHTYLQMLTTFKEFPEQHQEHLLNNSHAILGRLEKASRLLDNLHEPWHQLEDRPVNVNDCLNIAIREVFPEILQELQEETIVTDDEYRVHINLQFDLPLLQTSNDMLTEAFRVLIKNGKEAMAHSETKNLWISSASRESSELVILIEDSGQGIQPENLQNIFELGWSTKGTQGMGFGLFWTRDFIRGLNGEITVQSVIDEGTTFTIVLPTAS
ncbi:MAG: GAF domain-containing protein [Chloroflexota bacterium]